MSDHPGCHCGHPEAEPEWIDHIDDCPYLGDVDKANALLAAAREILGVRPDFNPHRRSDVTNRVRRDIVRLMAMPRRLKELEE